MSTKLCESFHWCVLQFGDQLHEVNGFSFLSIPHRQAVAILARNTSLSILYKVWYGMVWFGMVWYGRPWPS